MKKYFTLILSVAALTLAGCADQQLTNCKTENEALKQQVKDLEEQAGSFVQLNEVSDELLNSEIERLTKENEELKKKLEQK